MRKTTFIGKVSTWFWAKNAGFWAQKSKSRALARKAQAPSFHAPGSPVVVSGRPTPPLRHMWVLTGAENICFFTFHVLPFIAYVGEFKGVSRGIKSQCFRITKEGNTTSPPKILRHRIYELPLLYMQQFNYPFIINIGLNQSHLIPSVRDRVFCTLYLI